MLTSIGLTVILSRTSGSDRSVLSGTKTVQTTPTKK